ncbi:MAG: dihydrofolate reductase [Lachnospiraceae bacterium]|nr:dihydrofolate reductase [Lachnospiraceae bacterium]
MSLSLIAAVGKNRELGKDGGLYFRIPGDLKFFKKTTMGYPVFMGLTTFYSLPKKLPGRKHYVAVFEHEAGLDEDITQVEDIFAFAKEWQQKEEEIFVIGGASIYAQMLPYCDKLYLTEVEGGENDADVYFPKFNKRKYSRKTLGKGEDNGVSYKWVLYTKKPEQA